MQNDTTERTGNDFKETQDFFVCANYRSNTGTCTGHYIWTVTLNRLVFRHIQNVLSYIQQFEASFVKQEKEKAELQHQMPLDKARVDIVTLRRRDEDLDTLIAELQELIDSSKQSEYDLKEFLKNIRKYPAPKELTPELLNDLVDKIIVHAPDKSSGHRKQKIEIYYKAVGIINITNNEYIALDGRLGMKNRRKRTA